MKKMQEHVVEGKRVFVGLEDSKRSWKVCVRSGGMIVQESSLPADYDNLRRYLERGYPGCEIWLMYEAGFGGFWLHDRLTADGVHYGFPAGVWTKADYERARGLQLRPFLQVCLESYFQLLAGLETVRQRLLLELKGLCGQARYQQGWRLRRVVRGLAGYQRFASPWNGGIYHAPLWRGN